MLNYSVIKYFLLTFILLVSCVYSFSGGFPSKFRNIYLMPVENESSRQDITVSVQNLFSEYLQKDGRLNLVSKDRAGLFIEPVIKEFKKTPTEFTEAGEVTLYTISLNALIKTPVKGDTVMFLKDSIFHGRGVYKVGEEEEAKGIERAVEDLVNNFLGKLFEVKI